MEFWNYLIHDNPGFGTPSLSLGALVLYIGTAIASVLWLRSAPPKNPARLAYRKRTATGLLIVSGIGIVQLITRMFYVDGIEWRLWSYLIFFAFLGYAGYAFWDARNRLPAQIAANTGKGARQRVDRTIAHRKPSPASQAAAAGESAAPASEPRPLATTGRRDARRAKKRRK